jgi:hypothetical protein
MNNSLVPHRCDINQVLFFDSHVRLSLPFWQRIQVSLSFRVRVVVPTVLIIKIVLVMLSFFSS